MTDEREAIVRKALQKAYSLGQTYWQQADSEYASQWRKSGETAQQFCALVEETIESLLSHSSEAPTLDIGAHHLERDAMTLCLALFCVPESNMAPETREVMRRWDRKIQLHIEAAAA